MLVIDRSDIRIQLLEPTFLAEFSTKSLAVGCNIIASLLLRNGT
jgi:hypothetical protein